MACRLGLKMGVLATVMLAYLTSWYVCEACLLWITACSCAVSLLGAPFMSPACAAGAALTLIKGISMSSGPLRLDLQWHPASR